MYAIINGKVIDGHSLLNDCAIIIDEDLIVKTIHISDLPPSIEKLDVNGAYVTPGFIDLQMNGCGGILFNDNISIEAIKAISDTNIKFGCTSFLITLTSAPKEHIKEALNVSKNAYHLMPNNVLGVHIEGPYISKIKKGIHNEAYIRTITEEEANIFRSEVKHIPIMLTLAPEVNDLGLVSNLIQSGILVSLGHSNASYEETVEFIDAGVKSSTHLFNAMTQFHHRKPGIVTAILNNPDVTCGMIMDGFHVNFELIKLIKKIKQENLYIVTDASPAAGCNDITKFRFGGNDLVVTNGKAVDRHGTLGGSVITMIESVYNVAEILGFGLVEAIRMSSLYPAKIMGVHNKLGLIKHGYVANLAIFDSNYNMLYTIINGKLIRL